MNEEFNIKECIEEALQVSSIQAMQKNVELIYEVENNEMIMGDHLRIRQILINLLSNAIKFTNKENSIITVCGKINSDEDDRILQLSVEDEGVGISNESLKNIFKGYMQSNPARDQQLGGIGIGLTIVKSLVELMRGKIWVESEEGKGTKI